MLTFDSVLLPTRTLIQFELPNVFHLGHSYRYFYFSHKHIMVWSTFAMHVLKDIRESLSAFILHLCAALCELYASTIAVPGAGISELNLPCTLYRVSMGFKNELASAALHLLTFNLSLYLQAFCLYSMACLFIIAFIILLPFLSKC